MNFNEELISNIDKNKIEKIISYSKKKWLAYILLFSGIVMILSILISFIAIIVKNEYKTLQIVFLSLNGFFLLFWMLYYAHLLQLVSTSFVLSRALENEENPWRSYKPHYVFLKIQTWSSFYAFNLFKKKKNRLSKNEKMLLTRYLWSLKGIEEISFKY
ncbi:Uncharacterised protein [Mycoplasmopsis maculosa]|uniref:Uncharacterized protein n=1 Tax=Mycoplasmopsis maculosa TaxID=114885 RepID=A0A449B3T5_9BACT|nr:hypothetical protein [Mycoplasmopsis maculosa]VEU75261.1 Uncharacterised protein [Mycoplasmopsis maculosa]